MMSERSTFSLCFTSGLLIYSFTHFRMCQFMRCCVLFYSSRNSQSSNKISWYLFTLIISGRFILFWSTKWLNCLATLVYSGNKIVYCCLSMLTSRISHCSLLSNDALSWSVQKFQFYIVLINFSNSSLYHKRGNFSIENLIDMKALSQWSLKWMRYRWHGLELVFFCG
jgi:hypothetical protein